MKPRIKKSVTFIGKSILWSFLLYMSMMLIFNWDDVSRAVSGKSDVTIVNTVPADGQSSAAKPNTAARNGAIKSIFIILETLGGSSARPAY